MRSVTSGVYNSMISYFEHELLGGKIGSTGGGDAIDWAPWEVVGADATELLFGSCISNVVGSLDMVGPTS